MTLFDLIRNDSVIAFRHDQSWNIYDRALFLGACKMAAYLAQRQGLSPGNAFKQINADEVLKALGLEYKK